MKKLFLLRHAEASSMHSASDKDRPLTAAGQNAAQALGVAMQAKGYHPTLAYCSPALRTRQTLSGLTATLSAQLHTDYPASLYNAAYEDIFARVRQSNADIERLLVVAHNPGIYELVIRLTGSTAPGLSDLLTTGYKPGTFSVLECPCASWADLQYGKNKLQDVLLASRYTPQP